jgi:rpsU-divergently transcribed protein
MIFRQVVGSATTRLLSRAARRWCTSSQTLRAQILEASLNNVASLGWTQDSIAKGVMDLGLPPLSHRILSRGPIEVVEYFIDKKRTYAKERVAALQGKYAVLEHANESFNTVNNPGESPTGDKQSRTDEMMQESFEAHIDFLAPYVQTWPSALALFADPMQMSVAMTTGMQIADDIVTLGGIEASRNDWYTERLLAVMLYTSTELFLLSDKSPNFSDTRFAPGVLCCRVVAQVLVRLVSAAYSTLWGLYARQYPSTAAWQLFPTTSLCHISPLRLSTRGVLTESFCDGTSARTRACGRRPTQAASSAMYCCTCSWRKSSGHKTVHVCA